MIERLISFRLLLLFSTLQKVYHEYTTYFDQIDTEEVKEMLMTLLPETMEQVNALRGFMKDVNVRERWSNMDTLRIW